MAPVQDAIARLPAPLREVVTLFYVHECSQQDIATFSGSPGHDGEHPHPRGAEAAQAEDADHGQGDARGERTRRLRQADWLDRADAERVVEARFDPASLPDVLTELSVSDESRRRAATVQVVQRLEDGSFGVATAPADGLLRA